MAELMFKDGSIVDVFNLKVEDIKKDIIIFGACRINRFLGQTEKPYSVACHLIGGWNLLNDLNASNEIKKQWLLHEAFESYTGVDLPSPLKALLPEYVKAEKESHAVFERAFNVKSKNKEFIKDIDNSMMVTEALVLMNNDNHWYQMAKDRNIDIVDKKYVLTHLNNELEVRTELERIWNITFNEGIENE